MLGAREKSRAEPVARADGLRLAGLIALGALALAGCPTVTPPPPPPPPTPDAGPVEPDAPGPRIDTDGDGLCDDTEIGWGVPIDDADSDDDGFSDYVERIYGFSALDPDSPRRDSLVFLNEGAETGTQLPIMRVIRGQGETYTGAFSPSPDTVTDPQGLDALSFLESDRAVGASPPENVVEVDEERRRFIGVFGRTQLFWEVRFDATAAELARGCGRIYRFQYDVKRDDGVFVLVDRSLLVVLPPGERLGDATWCQPESCI